MACGTAQCLISWSLIERQYACTEWQALAILIYVAVLCIYFGHFSCFIDLVPSLMHGRECIRV